MTWDVSKPADTDLRRIFPAQNRADKTTLQTEWNVEHDALGTGSGHHKPIVVAISLTNKSGLSIVAGDVLVIDTANDQAAVLGDTVSTLQAIVIAAEAIANNVAGRFYRFGGNIICTATTAVRGNYLRKSATTRALEDTGVAVAVNTAPPRGACAIAETNVAAGQVTALLLGFTVSTTDGTLVLTLTNKTGGALVPNDIVGVDTVNDSAVVLDDSNSSLRTMVVALDSIANNAAGRFVWHGITTVAVNNAIIHGSYIRKSNTTKALETTAAIANSTTAAPSSSCGIALTAFAGPGLGTVVALMLGFTAGGAGGGGGTGITIGLFGTLPPTIPLL